MEQKIIEILNKYETCQDSGFNVIGTDFGKKEELAADLVKLFDIGCVSLSLLKVAKCANINCDNNGTIPTWNEYDNEWEPEPCQWCYEKKKLLNNEG